MENSAKYHPSAVIQQLFNPLCSKQHIKNNLDTYNTSLHQQCYAYLCHFSIDSACPGVATHASKEYHTGEYNTELLEPYFLQYFLNS